MRLYVKGTSGARWCRGVRSAHDPPGRRPRRRTVPRLVAALAVAALRGESGIARRCGPRPRTIPTTSNTTWRSPRSARRSPPTRRMPAPTAASRRAVAEHHVPPRQHDRGRLPRPAEQAERQPAAARHRPRRSPDSSDAIERRSRWPGQRIAQNPKDADAHYQLGAAVGLRASYTATVEGSVLGAFRAAREAYDEHEKVLSLAAAAQGRRAHRRHLSLHRRGACRCRCAWSPTWPASAAARRRGIKQIEDAAAYGGDNQTDARFALHAALQPRAALRRCAEAAGAAARAVSAQSPGLARDRDRRRCAPGGRRTPSAS